MAINATIRLQGLREIDRALVRMERGLAKRIMRKALGAGARHIRNEARSHAPRDTGLLRKAIWARVKVNRRFGAIARIGIRNDIEGTGDDGRLRRPIKYAHLVEFGTSSFVQPKKLHVNSNQKHLGGPIQQPARSPQPFMRKAAGSRNLDKALKIFAEKAWTEIRKAGR